MNHPVRFLTVLAALGLLVAVFAAPGATTVQAVDDGEVGWVSASGDAISFVTDGVDATFHINDDDLGTTQAGTATFRDVSAGTKYINLATGVAGPDSTATTTALAAEDISDGYMGADTPLVTDALTTQVTGNFALSTEAGGGITLLEAVSGGDIEVSFQHHVTDSYDGNLRDVADGKASDGPTGSQRAKVTSTSDPQGEWVSITESTATSNMFSGMVSLSADAASSGTAGVCTQARVDHDNAAGSGPCEDSSAGAYADGGVWVQDDDTLTVTYYDSGLAAVATDTVTVDTVSPQISNISPASGSFTRVGNPTISFDVTDTGSGIDIQNLDNITLTINGVEATGVSYLSIDDGVRAIYARPISEWTSYGVDTGDDNAFPISITAMDGAGNSSTVGTADSAHTIDIDLDRPTVRTADAESKTKVVVTFSEPLDGGSVDSEDFEVTGASVTAASRMADDGDTPDNEERVVELTVTDLEPDAKPEVSVVGTVTDKAGNTVDTATSKVTASDSIGATITSLEIDSPLVGEDGEVGISLSFDEKLATNGVQVTVHGPSGGAATVSRPSPLAASTTFSVGDNPTGIYGVSVQVTDLGNNTTNNLDSVTETVSVDGTMLTLGSGPIGDANFDGTVDGGDLTLSDDSVTVSSVDASARTVTLSAAHTGDLEVTYHAVPAGATFQVDVSAPTVMVEPSDGSTVKDQSPFIRIVFDEDEYPGDSNTSVTLDSATLTGPDGADMDVTEVFQAGTGDNIEFIWAASDLALGGYTLSLSATDAADNTLETSSAFTVAKRTASIALRPGWNLVSIPGSLAPDKRGVNDVFSNGAIDIVLTYDAKRRNWYRATRQDDGTLGQPGSSLELSMVSSRTAYWVHSSGVVTQSVDLLGASSQEPPVSIDLVAGWNLIPVRTTEVGSDPVDADDYLSGLSWTRAYGYNNTSQVFEAILPGSDATLAENNGYWVYLRDAGVLVP